VLVGLSLFWESMDLISGNPAVRLQLPDWQARPTHECERLLRAPATTMVTALASDDGHTHCATFLALRSRMPCRRRSSHRFTNLPYTTCAGPKAQSKPTGSAVESRQARLAPACGVATHATNRIYMILWISQPLRGSLQPMVPVRGWLSRGPRYAYSIGVGDPCDCDDMTALAMVMAPTLLTTS
jgi:hypothetical protein